MSVPTAQPASWKEFLRVNLLAASGVLVVFNGWLCWQIASPEWWAFWPIGAISMAGGVMQVIRAVNKTVTLIRNHTKWRRFERSGTAPRADHMASNDDLNSCGYTK